MAPDTAWPSALLLDLQGVLVEDRHALPGAVDTVNRARRRGVAIRFVTNTATRHHDDLLQDLQQLGLAAEPSELATAPLAAKSWLEREQRHPMALVHPAIAPLFAGSSAEQPDCVLLGDGRDLLSYANLNTALELLMQGAPLIGIGRNRRFREAGRWMLDAGAFLQALEYGADCTALVMGKPSAEFFSEVVRSLGLPADACLMVGDDVEADVCGAAAAGLRAWLVQTGKCCPGDEGQLPRGCAVISGIGALPEQLGW